MALTFKQLGMLATVGWCLGVSTASAQLVPREQIPVPPAAEAVPAPAAAAPAPGAPYLPALPEYGGQYGGPYAGPLAPQPGPIAPPPPPPVARGPLHKLLNNHGLACASSFQAIGCGNFASEFAFIFGSCRTFFAQPCLPTSRQVTNGADGRDGSGRRGCCGY
jgi:hypothetical protein